MFSPCAAGALSAREWRFCSLAARVALMSLGLGFGVAQAASFEVGPVLIELSSRHPVAVEGVRNDSDTPVTIQVSVTAWDQSENADRYTPTRDLVATPPIFTVPPGGRQIVRVASRLPWPSQRERSYRMFLQQVPSGREPGQRAELQVLLRFGVPVFVEPSSRPVAAKLVWSARLVPHGLELTVDNAGTGHARIDAVTVAQGTGQPLAKESAGLYVLPGRARSLTLTSTRAVKPGMRLHLTAQTDTGEVSADAVVAR